jgi:hypothetical protein
MFWDGCKRWRTHQELTQQMLTRIWEESPEIVVVDGELLVKGKILSVFIIN